MKRFSLAGWILIAAWLSYMFFITRYAMLDDALIHLRYAAFLRDVHSITFDGLHPSYGTSSLLYVILLAFMGSFTSSALLPKIISCICYSGIIVLVAMQVRRFAPRHAPQVVWIGFLLTLLSPMAIRWLTDGMYPATY